MRDDDGSSVDKRVCGDTSSSRTGQPNATACHMDQVSDSIVPKQFKQQLRDIFRKQETIAAGAVHLIGLDDLQNRLGPRWEGAKERVHALTRRLIERNLSPKDAWFQYGDNNYVIAFSNLQKQAAQLVCANIATQLHQLLLGADQTGDITVQTAVMELNGGVEFEMTRLDTLLNAVVKETAIPPNAVTSPPDAHASGENRRVPSLEDCSGSSLESRILNFQMELMSVENEVHPVRILYSPVWDVQRQVISTYVCRANRVRPGREDAWGYGVLNNAENTAAILDLDIETLSRAIATYNELFQNRFRCILGLPVHFETIAVIRRRREYLQLCRMIPQCLMPFLIFNLAGLPRGIPYSRLMELVTTLKPFCRSVIAQEPTDPRDLPTYAQAGLKGAGFKICRRDGEAKSIEDIRSFSMLAHKVGVASYISGIYSETLLTGAENAGAEYLAGPTIGDFDEFPGHMRRMSHSEIVAHLRDHPRP